ncbi:MAG: hypothetical protein CME88_04085 [Hirschia sp.]|nr:hypothetical protein [Hirschia sp.]MBF17538.1 hypothetical protein [Hirschia sp.]
MKRIASLPSDEPARRLADIIHAIGLIEDYVRQAGGLDALMTVENAYHDAVERRLLIIAEAVTKLRGQIETLEPDIPWRDIRQTGNVIRHNYDGVNDAVIRSILEQDLAPLRAACERLLKHFST